MISRCLLLSASLVLVCLKVPSATATTSRYRVDFNATWSAVSHPYAYPAANAHFSPLIGGIHNDQATFWVPGGMATLGIERMAEIGSTTALRDEVQAAMNAGNALSVIQGYGTPSPGSTSVTFEVSPDFPLVTLVTMVAPTPDWFVGVHGLDLRDGAGWKDQVTVELFAYDAGTEEGVGFSLANPETVPHQPIALLGYPFTAGDPRLATYTFTRLIESRELGDFNNDRTVDATDYIVWRNGLGTTYMQSDYDVWRANYGITRGSGTTLHSLQPLSAAVPEPVNWLVILTAILTVWVRPRTVVSST